MHPRRRARLLVPLAAGLLMAGRLEHLPPEAAAEAPTREPAEQPFAADSVWNTPLGRGARFAAADAPETLLLHTDDAGGPKGAFPWIGDGAIGLARATRADRPARWSYQGRSASAPWPHDAPVANGAVQLLSPPTMQFLGGSDGHAVLIRPDGEVAYEVWQGSGDAATGYRAVYLVRVDLRGSGVARREGDSDGIRAFGGSLLGGLIRCDELARGNIPHALAVLLSTTQLRQSPSMAGQKVWPATLSDGGGRNRYAGLVPMGALLAIPPDVDLNALELTPSGLTLARAYQRFGGYVVDATDKTMTLATLAPGCDRGQVRDLERDRRTIRDRLVRVVNNGPDHPGGPGPRVAPAPPPLRPRATSPAISGGI